MNAAKKKEVLHAIEVLAAQNAITQEEMLEAHHRGADHRENFFFEYKVGVPSILYYLGGLIVCLGISHFIWNKWVHLALSTKLCITLGVGIFSFCCGLFTSLHARFKETGISLAFYLISAITLSLGLSVLFETLFHTATTTGMWSIIAACMTALFAVSYAVFRQNIFIVFAALFGTASLMVATHYFFGFGYSSVMYISVLCSGILYLAASLHVTHQFIAAFLSITGTILTLGAALLLLYPHPTQQQLIHPYFWEALFPALAIAVISFGIYTKRKSCILLSTLFCMVYILHVANRYFLHSPGGLVIAGVLIIALGYATFYVHRDYLKEG